MREVQCTGGKVTKLIAIKMENKPYFSIKSMEDIMSMLQYTVRMFARQGKEKQQEQQRSIEIKRKNDEEEKERNEDNNAIIPQLSQNIFYQNTAQNQGPNYGPVFTSYLERRHEAMNDFTDRVPGKHLHTFPSSGNAGLYGFTYLGDQRVWRRDDLIGSEFAKMVDVHECIHTPDEYETRRITEWMMEKEKSRYIK